MPRAVEPIRVRLSAVVRALRQRLLVEVGAGRKRETSDYLLREVALRQSETLGLDLRRSMVAPAPSLLAPHPPDCPLSPGSVQAVRDALHDSSLDPAWRDDTVLGWVYQFWNDPDREALDERVKNRGKIEHHEIATKTQVFTDRYMVEWILQNTIGSAWLAICARRGWKPEAIERGTLARLEARRAAHASPSSPTAFPVQDHHEHAWRYWVPRALPDSAVEHAPDSLREMRLLDPACGTGHFLVLAFDRLVPLYEEEARHRGERWAPPDIARWILEDNLHGADIDARAIDVALASLLLRASSYARCSLDSTGLARHLAPLDPTGLGSLERAHPHDLLSSPRYDLVVTNPPYHSTAKMACPSRFQQPYPEARGDLFGAFMVRCLELCRPWGLAATATLSNWLYLDSFTALREHLLTRAHLELLVDLGKAAFTSGSMLINASLNVFRNAAPGLAPSLALRPFPPDRVVVDPRQADRNEAALLRGAERFAFDTRRICAVVPGRPLLYAWPESLLQRYARAPLLGDVADVRKGMTTGHNARFLRKPWELPAFDASSFRLEAPWPLDPAPAWVPYVKGASGKTWLEPLSDLLCTRHGGLELALFVVSRFGPAALAWKICNRDAWFGPGVAYATIGHRFSARLHRYRSAFDSSGSSIFGACPAEVTCLLNSRTARDLLSSLNPTVNYQPRDVKRLPFLRVEGATEIVRRLEEAFSEHEAARETSVEFRCPGPSRWTAAQAWGHDAVDRAEGRALPPFDPSGVPAPAHAWLSYAFGIVMGRLGAQGQGWLRQAPDDAIPHGVLFLSDAPGAADGLDHPAARPLLEAWHAHGQGDDLRAYLCRSFFPEVHRPMYENRPIYFPLSSGRRHFVAWVSIHRWTGQTLPHLLSRWLEPELARLDTSAPADGSLRDELRQFIRDLRDCAAHGPPPAREGDPAREANSSSDMCLDDGVLVNAATLWPLLEPQWSDPRDWWHDLSHAEGRTDHDWSRAAARYFPSRVDARCRRDPSLALAHGLLSRHHPGLADGQGQLPAPLLPMPTPSVRTGR